jgi:hypothetical protein
MNNTPIQYDYTDEEYQALAEVLAHNSTAKPLETAVTAKRWLESWEFDFVRNYLQGPLEDVPLRINDEVFVSRVLTQWRLKIAR